MARFYFFFILCAYSRSQQFLEHLRGAKFWVRQSGSRDESDTVAALGSSP